MPSSRTNPNPIDSSSLLLSPGAQSPRHGAETEWGKVSEAADPRARTPNTRGLARVLRGEGPARAHEPRRKSSLLAAKMLLPRLSEARDPRARTSPRACVPPPPRTHKGLTCFGSSAFSPLLTPTQLHLTFLLLFVSSWLALGLHSGRFRSPKFGEAQPKSPLGS